MGLARLHHPDTLTRYVLAWIPMLVIAVANGALRQTMFAKVMPELRAHQLSWLALAPWIFFRIRAA